MKKMNKKQDKRQVAMYIVTLFVFATLSIIAALFGSSQIEKQVRTSSVHSLQAILESTTEAIEYTWAEVRFAHAHEWAKNPIMISNTKLLLETLNTPDTVSNKMALRNIREFMKSRLNPYNAQGIFIISNDMISRASMRDQNIGSKNLIAKTYPERLDSVFLGKQQLIPPIMSDVPLPNKNGILQDNYPTMFIVVPIFHNKKVIAALSIRFNPFDEFSLVTKKGRIGKSGETYIVNCRGTLLSESRFLDDLYNAKLLQIGDHSILNIEARDPLVNLLDKDTLSSPIKNNPLTFSAQEISKKNSGQSSTAYRDYRGVPVIGVWHWDNILGVGFITKIDEKEVLEPYREARNVITLLVIIIILFSFILFFIIQRIHIYTSKQIMNQEQYVEDILNNLYDTVIATDENGKIESTNHTGVVLFNYSLPEFMAMSINDLFENQVLADPLGETKFDHCDFNNLDQLETERKAITKNGDTFIARVLRNSISFSGKVIHVFTIYDISVDKEQKEALEQRQQEIEERNIELRESGEIAIDLAKESNIRNQQLQDTLAKLQKTTKEIQKLSKAIEQSHASIEITNKDGNIEYVNQAYLNVTGYTYDEIINQNPRILKSGIHNNVFYANLWDTISSGEVWIGEFANRKKDGTIFWESATISPIKNENDEVTDFVAVKEDITFRKQIEKDLKHAKEKADSANRAKSEFLANMTHEIRTPMNAIIGFSEILSKQIQDPVQKNYINSIRSSGKTLLLLINDILDLSKIEAGKLQLLLVPTSLSTMVKELHSLFNHMMQEKNISFNIVTPPGIPEHFLLDELRLNQVLINLLSNAFKFTDTGTISLTINVIEKSANTFSLTFLVGDTGIGIGESDQQLIFDAFSQKEGQDTRKYGGTGLGLAISNKLTDLMGGKLSLKSEQGVGSTFFFTLENVAVFDGELPQSSNAHIDPLSIHFKKSKVLVVDDIEQNRTLFKSLLLDYELEIREAVNGQECLDICKEYTPDIIFMDIRMPVMDGYETTKSIRENEALKDIPIIALTASVLAENDYVTNGFNQLIKKPIELIDILHVLTVYLPFFTDAIEEDETTYPFENSFSELQNNSEVRAIVTNDILPLIESRSALKSHKVIISIAQKLMDIATTHNIKGLHSFGEELHIAVSSFDVDKTDNMVHTLIEQLKFMQEG